MDTITIIEQPTKIVESPAAPKIIKHHYAKKSPMYPLKGCGIRGSHQERKRKKFSSTPGHTKAGCKANWRDRGVCRISRSYKWNNYSELMAKVGKSKAAQS